MVHRCAARADERARASLSTLEPFVSDRLLEGLRLLITELMTNCVRHAGVDEHSAMGLSIHLSQDKLRGVVSDAGPGFERPDVVAPHADKPGGFGLVILDSISDRWGLATRDELFRVWFEVDVHGMLDGERLPATSASLPVAGTPRNIAWPLVLECHFSDDKRLRHRPKSCAMCHRS